LGLLWYNYPKSFKKETIMQNIMTLTDNAAKKLQKLKDIEGNHELMLRVYVTGGGCSGFSYGFDFADELDDDDATFDNGDATLVVDSLSYQYLHGSTIDYIEGLEGSRFVVDNPNATTTCGCGSSFSI
jgi:iron-sulfur cluster insertion protein erpA